MFEPHHYCHYEYQRPMKDLLFDQRKGKFLTHKEKERIKKEAELTRKKRLN